MVRRITYGASRVGDLRTSDGLNVSSDQSTGSWMQIRAPVTRKVQRTPCGPHRGARELTFYGKYTDHDGSDSLVLRYEETR